MPLNSVPPTVDVAGARREALGGGGPLLRRRGVLGRRGPRQRPRPAAAVGRGRARLQVLPGRLGGRGVPRPRRGRPAPTPPRPSRRSAGCCWCTPRTPTACGRRPSGNDYAGFAASRPPVAEVVAVEAVVAAVAGHRLPHPRGAPRGRGGPARRTRRPRRRRPRHRRDLPALPDPHRVRRARRRRRLQVLPAAARRRQPRRPVGRAARRHARHGRLRPLALPGRAEGDRCGRSGRRLGRGQLAPAGAGRHLDRGPAARARAARRGALDGHRPRRPGRPVAQGPDRRGRRRGPVRARARRDVRRRPGPARAPAPGHAVRRTDAHRRRPADLAGRAAGRPGRVAPRAAARAEEGPDEPRLHRPARPRLARARGERRVRQRRAVRGPGEPRDAGAARPRPARVRTTRQGLRRLGDPAPAHARQRPGDRAARRAGRGERRGRRHVLLRRQLPAPGERGRRGPGRLPVGGGAARRALAAARAGVRGRRATRPTRSGSTGRRPART